MLNEKVTNPIEIINYIDENYPLTQTYHDGP